jgi:hypothetical protein
VTSVAMTRGGGLVGDNLSPLDHFCHLHHGHDHVCPFVGSNILVLWHVWESFEISHSDGHVSVWSLEDLLISHHVKSVIKMLWVDFPLAFLLFRCSSLSVASVALLTLLPWSSILPLGANSSLLTLRTRSPHRGGKTRKQGNLGRYGGKSIS